MKKLLSIIITITMIISLNAASMQMVFAGTGSKTPETVTVYFTLSNDGEFVTGNDPDETVLCHVPVTISYFDLADYGMEDYYRYETDSFENGGGYIGDEVVKTPTVLHLYIKMLEKYYLGDGSKLIVGDDDQNALKISGSATSLYMTTFWNHDENLMYYVNHKYPLQAQGWGSTCDYILLEDGMDIDVAMFSDWDFYHTGAFAYFDSPDKEKNSNGQFETKVGEPITLTMRATATNAAYDGNSSFSGEPMPDETVTYTKAENAVSGYTNNQWEATDDGTDENGNATLTFSEPGIYYVSSTNDYTNYDMPSGNPCVAPPIAEIKVSPESTPVNPPDKPEEPNEDYTGKLFSEIGFRETQSKTSKSYATDGEHIIVPDTKSGVSVFADLDKNAPERTTLTATYTTYDGTKKTVNLKKDGVTGTSLTRLVGRNGNGNTLTITATCENEHADDVVETKNFIVDRQLTLKNLSMSDQAGEEIDFDEKFSPQLYQYSATVNADVNIVNVAAEGFQKDYNVEISGQSTSKVTIKVSNGVYQSNYYIAITKKDTIGQLFTTTEGSILQIKNTKGKSVYQEVVSGKNTSVSGLIDGKEYTYTATKKGFVGKAGSFTAGNNGEIDLTLTKAGINDSIMPGINSSWSNFRGNDDNNGLTEALLPTEYTNSQLYWATKVGEGYGAGAPSSPIIVDDAIIYTTATTIVKVDKTTGQVLKTGTMSKTSAFNITPPTYADGMIFVALGAGTIQAFNADTLESIWVYHNDNYGQPNCPITYHEGYIYTGFWSGETVKADFVCLSVHDENPSKTDEEKVATWTYTKVGGFYWAGAYACDDFVLVSSDDEAASDASGNGSLISFNPLTGKVLDKNDNVVGDARSTICYDKVTDKYYFTSKGGYFYAATVSADGKIASLEGVQLGGASTSTPVVSKGRAYIGVNGAEQFGVNSGHSITVINLDDMTIAYRLLTRGYPQTSGLLTTGYESVDGYAYVYFIDNYEPGKVRVLKDKPGQKEAIITRTSEYDDDNDYNVLFTPKNDQANYAICSLITDEDGTMYFKNDSCYMFALGSKIEKLEIEKAPDKTDYLAGETFDPAGMKVVARLANGRTRDVTSYVEYSQKALTTDMVDIHISYPYISYNDELEQYQHFKELLAVVDISVTDTKEYNAVMEVSKMIDALPDNVKLSDYDAIMAADKAYTELKVSTAVVNRYLKNYSKLQSCEEKLAQALEEYAKTNPLNVKVVSAGYDSITLSWNTLGYDFKYDVYKLGSNGKYRLLGRADTLSYTDSNLICGTEYKYIIKPVITFSGGNRKLVELESAAVTGTPALGNVKLTSVKKGEKNEIALSWEKVDGAEGYIIYRSDKKSGEYKAIYTIADASATTHNNTGLVCGKSYYYKVLAYKVVNGKQIKSGSFSNIIGVGNLAHSYVYTVKRATTTANGAKSGKCSVCGAVKSKQTIYKASGIKISAVEFTYNGKKKTPSVTVKNSKGKKIAESNYKISYSSGRKNVGKYKVTIKLKGDYRGAVTKTFKINPKGTSVTMLKATKKGFKVAWKKQAVQTSGYEIRYSLKSSMKNSKKVTVGKAKTTSKTVGKLSAKKKYYIQIRTYKKVSDVKYYSKWSKAKSVTTK